MAGLLRSCWADVSLPVTELSRYHTSDIFQQAAMILQHRLHIHGVPVLPAVSRQAGNDLSVTQNLFRYVSPVECEALLSFCISPQQLLCMLHFGFKQQVVLLCTLLFQHCVCPMRSSQSVRLSCQVLHAKPGVSIPSRQQLVGSPLHRLLH